MTMFGTFLISRGVITSTQVVEALDSQRSQRVPPASIAMRRGVLDAHQTLRTMDEERITRRAFAECAVALGFATREAMQAVVEESERSGPLLGEVLVMLGHIPREILDREVTAFERFLISTPRFGVPIPGFGQRPPRRDEPRTAHHGEHRGDAVIELARHGGGRK